MLNHKKTLIACVLTIALIISPLYALAEKAVKEPYKEPIDPMAMTLDLVIARPVGLVVMLAGTVLFVVSVPFSALGGNTEEAWDSLVVSPAEYTFQRPLGEFD